MAKEFMHAASGLMVRLEEEASGGFFATVPALPGCGSQGETINETLANVGDALLAVLDLLSEEEPERYERLIGISTSSGSPGAEPESTLPDVEIIEGA